MLAGRFADFPTLAAIAAVAAGCTAGSGKVDATLGSAQPPGAQVPGQLAATQPAAGEVQDPRAYCPKTVLRAGTETYNVFPDKMKKDDPQSAKSLRFRATITEIVRECNYAGDLLNIKVGLAGRLISGPAGETGQFLMPVRIAVTRGDEVLYTQLHEVPAEVPAGRTNATFNFVDPASSSPKPDRENVIIYVGYDEQKLDPAGAKAKPAEKQLQKVN